MGDDMSYDMSSMSGTSSLASSDSPLIRARRRDREDLSTGNTVSQRPDDIDDIHDFCQLLGSHMRDLGPWTKLQLQRKIHRILEEFGAM